MLDLGLQDLNVNFVKTIHTNLSKGTARPIKEIVRQPYCYEVKYTFKKYNNTCKMAAQCNFDQCNFKLSSCFDRLLTVILNWLLSSDALQYCFFTSTNSTLRSFCFNFNLTGQLSRICGMKKIK